MPRFCENQTWTIWMKSTKASHLYLEIHWYNSKITFGPKMPTLKWQNSSSRSCRWNHSSLVSSQYAVLILLIRLSSFLAADIADTTISRYIQSRSISKNITYYLVIGYICFVNDTNQTRGIWVIKRERYNKQLLLWLYTFNVMRFEITANYWLAC
jgi:hypothetical protein